MNSEADDFRGGMEAEEPGEEPVRILAEQEQDTSDEFVARVKRSIHRRTVAAQCTSLAWHLPKVVMVEMAGVVRHLLSEAGGKKESRS